MTTVPELNVPLMEATMARIQAEPEAWSQSDWAVIDDSACGTTMCFAGTAVVLAGARLHFRENVSVTGTCVMPDGSTHDIERLATHLLGLTPRVAYDLFYTMTEDVDEMHRKVKSIIESAQSPDGA